MQRSRPVAFELAPEDQEMRLWIVGKDTLHQFNEMPERPIPISFSWEARYLQTNQWVSTGWHTYAKGLSSPPRLVRRHTISKAVIGVRNTHRIGERKVHEDRVLRLKTRSNH